MPRLPELSRETFLQMIAAAGVEAEGERLEALFEQCQRGWRDLVALEAIDTSEVEPALVLRVGE